LLVAFEGIDGSGKTTTATLVADRLSAIGVKAKALQKRDPDIGSLFVRRQLRVLADCLWGIPHDGTLKSLGSLHWIYLNGAYFSGLHEAVSAETEPTQVVVLDRWINKFVARVTTNGEFTIDDVLELLCPMPRPDLVFLLDVPPEVAASRKAVTKPLELGPIDAVERDFVSYQATVRQLLLVMADRFGWTVIAPAGRARDEIAAEVADVVCSRLHHH